jgi:hypothetical protein
MYSDLTIVCGAKRYPVHRALLATRSSFFEGACRNSFLEAETGVIDLSEDDAEAVEHMVHCKHDKPISTLTNTYALLDFYHMDYLNKPLSRRSSQRSSRANSPPSSRFSRRSMPKKLNLALIEDPLLATMSATNHSMPLTPPADEPMFQNLDASSKVPDTPMADQFAFDELEGEQSEPELDVQTAHLVTHAKVYAIAEKYVCPCVIVCFLFSVGLRALICGSPFICAWRLLLRLRCAALVTRRFNTDKPRDLRQRHGCKPIDPPRRTVRNQISGYQPLPRFSVSVFLLHVQSLSFSTMLLSAVSSRSASAFQSRDLALPRTPRHNH